jgi:hypothetical protein
MEEWRALLAEQRASGQTQGEWCAANGVNLFTLRDRASQLKRQDKETADRINLRERASIDWVEVKPLAEEKNLAEMGSNPVLPKASKTVPPAQEEGEAEATFQKKSVGISITRGEWTITVPVGFEEGVLAGVLGVVKRICC